MKSLKTFSLALIAICLTFSCSINNVDEVDSDANPSNLEASISRKMSSNDVQVTPSGDLSGITDANNIEDALNTVKVTGGAVYLSDGRKNTNDHFYVSRNIVVDGFNGSLIGEGKNKTLIHAGRESDLVGFTPANSPVWSEILETHPPVAATVFQFDNSSGDVHLAKFSILVEDDAPAIVHSDYYGNDGTHIWTAIELIGGFFNTTIEDLKITGKTSNAYGNEWGFNLGWGIHVMPWGNYDGTSPPDRNQGTLTIKNINVENLAYDALLFMDYRDGSEIFIDNISAKNVGYGISASRINDSEFIVSNVDVECNNSFYSAGMFFFFLQSGPEISDSSIANTNEVSSLVLWNVENASVTNTSFVDCNSFLSSIGVFGASNCSITKNDYRFSQSPGWTENSSGPGAVFLNVSASENYIHEMKFPPGLTICDMVIDYGNNNTIHNWQSCQNTNQNRIATNKTNKEMSPPIPNHVSHYHIN